MRAEVAEGGDKSGRYYGWVVPGAATIWMMLRKLGRMEPVQGYGRLLRGVLAVRNDPLRVLSSRRGAQ